MASQVKLRELVDLALCNPEVGAVNFNHLRTLLLLLIRNDKTGVDKHPDSLNKENAKINNALNKENASLNKDNATLNKENAKINNALNSDDCFNKDIEKNNEHMEKDEGISDVSSQNSKDKIHAPPTIMVGSNDQLADELNRLSSIQDKLINRIKSIEDGFTKYEKYPELDKLFNNNKTSNENSGNQESEVEKPSIINKEEKDIVNNLSVDEPFVRCSSPADYLGAVWQNRKVSNRLETAEEGLDKLFSIVKELLEKSSNSDKKMNNANTNIETLQKEIEKINTQLNDQNLKLGKLVDNAESVTLSNEVSKTEEQNNKNDVGFVKQLEIFNKKYDTLDQKLNENSESISENKQNISNNKNIILEIQASLTENQTDLSEFESAVDLKSILDDIGKLKENVDSITQNMNLDHESAVKKNIDRNDKVRNLSSESNTEDGDNINGETSGLNQDKNDTKTNDETQNIYFDLSSQINKLREDLLSKADKEDLLNLENSSKSKFENLDQQIRDLNEELNKLKEQFEGMNISELKDITENIEALKKMSEEIEELRKLSHLKDLADNVEDLNKMKLTMDSLQNDFNEFVKCTVIKEGIEHLEDDQKQMMEIIDSLRNGERSELPATTTYDASVIAAIQNVAQTNRQDIATLKADLSIFKKLSSKPQQQPIVTTNNNTNNNGEHSGIDNQAFEDLQHQLLTLQEEQVKVVGSISNMTDDMKDEFYRKQQHIDALYDYIEKLQHNKADKNDLSSEIDVKANKQALDEKVNMSTFDERYQMLEEALQNTLDRLDHYVQKEATMNEALNKLNEELQTKMDSDAEKKLKKFMNERLKEIQKSRPVDSEDHQHSYDFDLRNAAGLRKPMPLSYHCISCDRPIDVTMRGSQPPIPQNFPSKTSMAPFKTYELDQLRQSKRVNIYDKFNVNRQCGGQHTITNTRLQKSLAPTTNQYATTGDTTKPESVPVSIIDCVMGKDGQIYRGRFRSNDILPPSTKKLTVANGRMKYSKYRSSYSANIVKPNSSSANVEESRPRSADDVQPVDHEPILLPPISREASIIKDQNVTSENGRSNSVNSVGPI